MQHMYSAEMKLYGMDLTAATFGALTPALAATYPPLAVASSAISVGAMSISGALRPMRATELGA